MSKSDASRAYIERFTASSFRLTQSIRNEDDKLKIDLDEVDVGIIIPHDFGRNISGNKPSRVIILVDGSTNPSDVSTAQLKLASISEMASQELLFQRITTSGMAGQVSFPIETTVQTLYNPTGNMKKYMIPGLIPIICRQASFWLPFRSCVNVSKALWSY